MGLGVRIEKLMWGSWTPHKVKMAVSGCPRNCAEATCKDFGVVCVDSGYELHFAGAAGMHVRATEKLCTVATEDEVLEYGAALVQLYRETARYLERIYKWAARVGVASIRAQIVDDAERRAILRDRFLASQRFSQDDPWAARAGGAEAHEFTPIARVPMLEAAE
jgi:nitrite reductase (NADH) large subunit